MAAPHMQGMKLLPREPSCILHEAGTQKLPTPQASFPVHVAFPQEHGREP